MMNSVERAGAVLALAAWATAAGAQPSQRQRDTLRAVGAALRACWVPPRSIDRAPACRLRSR
jgi:hypothetical protein